MLRNVEGASRPTLVALCCSAELSAVYTTSSWFAHTTSPRWHLPVRRHLSSRCGSWCGWREGRQFRPLFPWQRRMILRAESGADFKGGDFLQVLAAEKYFSCQNRLRALEPVFTLYCLLYSTLARQDSEQTGLDFLWNFPATICHLCPASDDHQSLCPARAAVTQWAFQAVAPWETPRDTSLAAGPLIGHSRLRSKSKGSSGGSLFQ